MVDFSIINDKNQIIAKGICLNRSNVITFLSKLNKSFPFPQRFTSKLIESDYSNKTICALLFVFKQLGFIHEIEMRKKLPVYFRFVKDMSINDMIIKLDNYK